MSESIPSEAYHIKRAVILMVLTGLCFVTFTGIVKYMGTRLPPAEMAFLRYSLGLVFLIPMLKDIRTTRLDLRQYSFFAVRGLCHAMGVICWFFAMTRISIAEVTAMNYMSPIYVTIAAALFLGERLAFRRIAAICFAFFGALLILRPGFREISTGHWAMLLTAIIFAGSYIIAKKMTAEVKPTVIVFMLSVFVPIGLAPFALADWVTPDLHELLLLLLLAGIATLGHYCMTVAFSLAPVTVTQPVTFLQLIWSTLIGALLFSEGVDIWVLLGGGVILLSVTFIAWREAHLKRGG